MNVQRKYETTMWSSPPPSSTYIPHQRTHTHTILALVLNVYHQLLPRYMLLCVQFLLLFLLVFRLLFEVCIFLFLILHSQTKCTRSCVFTLYKHSYVLDRIKREMFDDAPIWLCTPLGKNSMAIGCCMHIVHIIHI